MSIRGQVIPEEWADEFGEGDDEWEEDNAGDMFSQTFDGTSIGPPPQPALPLPPLDLLFAGTPTPPPGVVLPPPSGLAPLTIPPSPGLTRTGGDTLPTVIPSTSQPLSALPSLPSFTSAPEVGWLDQAIHVERRRTRDYYPLQMGRTRRFPEASTTTPAVVPQNTDYTTLLVQGPDESDTAFRIRSDLARRIYELPPYALDDRISSLGAQLIIRLSHYLYNRLWLQVKYDAGTEAVLNELEAQIFED